MRCLPMITGVMMDAAEEQLGEIVEWWMARREASPLLVMQVRSLRGQRRRRQYAGRW